MLNTTQAAKQEEQMLTPQQAAFVLGFWHGREKMKHISRRQAELKLPRGFAADCVDSYLNGHDDAVRGDKWRYCQIQQISDYQDANDWRDHD